MSLASLGYNVFFGAIGLLFVVVVVLILLVTVWRFWDATLDHRHARQQRREESLSPEQRAARSRDWRRIIASVVALFILYFAVSIADDWSNSKIRDRCIDAALAEMNKRFETLQRTGSIPNEFWYEYQDQADLMIDRCLRNAGL